MDRRIGGTLETTGAIQQITISGKAQPPSANPFKFILPHPISWKLKDCRMLTRSRAFPAYSSRRRHSMVAQQGLYFWLTAPECDK